MNVPNMQAAVSEMVSTQVGSGAMACLSQSRLVAAIMLACEGADQEAAQYAIDQATNAAVVHAVNPYGV